MQSFSNQNRRLLFSVIIKLLTFLGLIFLIIVFINSLFTENQNTRNTSNEAIPTVMLELSDMQKGQIKKTRWNNREVAVLLRQFPDSLENKDIDIKKDELHISINTNIRSKKSEFFVYFNTGDSKSCPLYYAGGIFKDVCSSNQYDEAGRASKNNPQPFMIEIPPHYFDKGTVVFGRWTP